MLLESPLDRPPLWSSDVGPRAESVVVCQCALSRNLADYPFPGRCSAADKLNIEKRLVATFDSLNLLSSGVYYSLASLTPTESRFLVERRLIAPFMLFGNEPRGVYVAEDHSFSIMINGADHLCLRAHASGVQPHEVWARLNLMDDTLAGVLDYAFEKRLGYLTSAMSLVGTGLKASLILHLPCLRTLDRLDVAAAKARGRYFNLYGVKAGYEDAARTRHSGRTAAQETARGRSVLHESLCADVEGSVFGHHREAVGDLFLLANEGTLGLAEEEIVFHLRHVAEEILESEDAAREELLHERPTHIEDRVGRALGIAGGARLMPFTEAMDLLSSIRLGVAAGLLHEHPVPELNEMLLRAQRAHIELTVGRECDELALTIERANLFRNRFGA